MSIVKYTAGEMKEIQSRTDWRRVDAMTDENIAEAVESDPDTRLLDANDFKKMRRRGITGAARNGGRACEIKSQHRKTSRITDGMLT